MVAAVFPEYQAGGRSMHCNCDMPASAEVPHSKAAHSFGWRARLAWAGCRLPVSRGSDQNVAVQDPELQECQAGMALALARLSLNAATQFTLIGRGLATAIARMIAHAPSTCMPAVSTIIMAVVAEGHSQGAVLVRAGVGASPS